MIVGVPVAPSDAEFVPRLLDNLRDMRRNYGAFRVVFCTEDFELADNLRSLSFPDVDVVLFDATNMPHRMLRITESRNKIREYFLEKKDDFLVFLDADMWYEPNILSRLESIAKKGYDVVYNVYRLRTGQIAYSGFGGTLVRRWVMEKVRFRCIVRNNRAVVDEVTAFKKDLLRVGARIYRDVLVRTEHRGHVMDGKLGVKDRLKILLGDFALRMLPEEKYVSLMLLFRRVFP